MTPIQLLLLANPSCTNRAALGMCQSDVVTLTACPLSCGTCSPAAAAGATAALAAAKSAAIALV